MKVEDRRRRSFLPSLLGSPVFGKVNEVSEKEVEGAAEGVSKLIRAHAKEEDASKLERGKS